MWPKFSNSGISMKEVFINLIRIWPEKPITLRGTLSRSSIIFEAGTMYGLEILHECDEIVKTKIQKVLGPNSYVLGEKLVGLSPWHHK